MKKKKELKAAPEFKPTALTDEAMEKVVGGFGTNAGGGSFLQNNTSFNKSDKIVLIYGLQAQIGQESLTEC